MSTRHFSTFPPEYVQLMEEALRVDKVLPFTTKKKAVTLRSQFNELRRSLRENKHPLGAVFAPLILTIHEESPELFLLTIGVVGREFMEVIEEALSDRPQGIPLEEPAPTYGGYLKPELK